MALKYKQTFYNIQPGLCTFGKAMANKQAVVALGGKENKEFRRILEEGAERVFLTSTTHGAEMSGLGAFIKTIEIMKRDNVVNHYWEFGKINNRNESNCNKFRNPRFFLC